MFYDGCLEVDLNELDGICMLLGFEMISGFDFVFFV